MEVSQGRTAGLDLVVVGGCGHVGLPLALCFASVGCRVGIYDTDQKKVERRPGGRDAVHGAGRRPTNS